jgi:hypothetical protein
MSPEQRGHGFHGRQGGDLQRHLPAILYTPAGKALRAHARRQAKNEAKRITAAVKKSGRIEFPDDRAEGVFEALVEIVHTKVVDNEKGNVIYEHKAKDRIAAASKVLEFAQIKPVTKTENVIKTAEAWLAEIGDDAE